MLYGELSIGIVLSGMGSDGVAGLRAMREKGGTTLVQTPESAKFDSMPRNAIEAGLAEIVAPVGELPRKLQERLGEAEREPAPAATPEKHASSLHQIIALLQRQTHQDFSLYKPSSLYRRIERRMAIHQMETITDYASFLKHNPQELDLLFKELLIGVTGFFRPCPTRSLRPENASAGADLKTAHEELWPSSLR